MNTKKHLHLERLLKKQNMQMYISSKEKKIIWEGESQEIKQLVELLWEESIESHTTNDDVDVIGKLTTTKNFKGIYDTTHFSNNTCTYQPTTTDKKLRNFYFKNYIIPLARIVLTKYMENKK